MCDQDHFEEDRRAFEAAGLVTRKQFGAMLGAGIAMMLPRVANAVTVTESEVNWKPFASRATAVRVWNPSLVAVVSQGT